MGPDGAPEGAAGRVCVNMKSAEIDTLAGRRTACKALHFSEVISLKYRGLRTPGKQPDKGYEAADSDGHCSVTAMRQHFDWHPGSSGIPPSVRSLISPRFTSWSPVATQRLTQFTILPNALQLVITG